MLPRALSARLSRTSFVLGFLKPQIWAKWALYFVNLGFYYTLFRPTEWLIRRCSAVGQQPFFTPSAFAWIPGIEANWTAIRGELRPLLADRVPHTLADLYTFYVAPAYRDALATSSPSPRLRAFCLSGKCLPEPVFKIGHRSLPSITRARPASPRAAAERTVLGPIRSIRATSPTSRSA